MRQYIIDVVFNNLKDNIKEYSDNNDKYFEQLKNLVEIIEKDDSYLKYFIEHQDALMLITEEILKDIRNLPYIYDLREGI